MWWYTVTHGRGSEGETGECSGRPVPFTLPRNTVYPALIPLMRTPRLPVVDWTDAPDDLNGLVRFAGRRNLVSARVPSHFKRSLPLAWTVKNLRILPTEGTEVFRVICTINCNYFLKEQRPFEAKWWPCRQSARVIRHGTAFCKQTVFASFLSISLKSDNRSVLPTKHLDQNLYNL